LKYIILILLLFAGFTAVCQNYIRGQVTDKHRQRLPSVKIVTAIGKQVYKTDQYGNFGFSSTVAVDTLVFSCDGYDTLRAVVKAEEYARIVLRTLPYSVVFTKDNLSVVIQHNENTLGLQRIKDETYKHSNEFNFQQTVQSPGIAFSANINRASYSNVRRLINEMESLLPPHAVRIEEMLNYFNFNYTEPTGDSAFHCASYRTDCPWNKSNELLFVNISARKINMANIPPNNLVFLIDVSGSMDMPNKLPLLKSGFIKMVKNLRAIDTVSIITFGESVNLLLEGASGSNWEKITDVIEKLTADGPTPGESAIKLAFAVAKRRLIKAGNNRIILAADGDFNVGVSTEKELVTLIEKEKQKGIYLTCIGVGSGNYKDSRLSVLAQKGNGNFAYIDNEQEAERVLVTDLTKTLFTVADNVYLSMYFNPQQVKAYRLLGYENENTLLKDSLVQLKGGEIGSGHSLMAVFECIPNPDTVAAGGWMAKLQVHYRLPQLYRQYSIAYTCQDTLSALKSADAGIKKAACVVMFGIKLKDSEYSKTIKWKNLQKLANGSFNKSKFLEKEFLQLIGKAKKMYTHRRKYGGDYE
jgi:Ca-activated chloride channel family protein